ncbi:putative MFS-type transporter [Yarrowia sp. C11]|nr:putative MFS-type transporter [Yarrowia sp. E02]KAG5369792.1 putative MFS-type transporter [Yarrowia sp. C11]
MLDYTKIPGTSNWLEASQIVKLPVPSDDPDDPLNWSYRRKILSMICMSAFTLSSGVATASIYSILVPISQDSGLPLATLNQGTGYMFLFLGLGCLVWQPLGQQYGKRPMYLISLLLTLASQIWSAHAATSNGHWIGSKIFQGLVQAPIESLCEVTISDVWFEHERGRWVGLYAFMLLFSNFIAPVVAAPIAVGQSWPWVLYWEAIFCGVVTIFLFFFFEETNYSRHTATYISEVEMEGETEVSSDSIGFTSQADVKNPVKTEYETGEVTNYSQKTFVQKLRLFDKPRPMMLWTMFKRPFKLLLFPAIVYSGFLYGSSLVWFNVLNATASLILSSPPYNFGTISVGLSYFSPSIVAGIVGWGGGYLSDVLKMSLARRNNGVSEPEHRLWILVFYLAIVPGALILWGVGAANNVHWFGLIMAMGLIGGCGTLAATASVSYAIDSYREVASDSMATVIVIRNLMSFGIGYGITPWLENQGYAKTFGEGAGVCAGCGLVFLVFIVYGKKWRDMTKERYWKLVQESIDKGIAH